MNIHMHTDILMFVCLCLYAYAYFNTANNHIRICDWYLGYDDDDRRSVILLKGKMLAKDSDKVRLSQTHLSITYVLCGP